MYGFTIQVIMLVLVKLLSVAFLKELPFPCIFYLSSPANQSVQLEVKRELEIEGV